MTRKQTGKTRVKAAWYGALVIAVLGLVVMGSTVVVAQSQKSEVGELTELATALGNADVFSKALDYLQQSVAGVFGGGTRYPHGISADTTSPAEGEVRGTTLTITGNSTIGGTLGITGTTTPSATTYSTVYVALAQTATTTTASPAPLAQYCNSGSDLLFDWVVDIDINNGLWGERVGGGTTTCSGVIASNACPSGSSLAATGTETLFTASFVESDAVFSVTSGSLQDNGATSTLGTYYGDALTKVKATSSPLLLKNGECLVVHGNQEGATSSASYTAAGGWVTYVGSLIVNAVLR